MDIEGLKHARLGAIYLWQGIHPKSPIADAIVSGTMTSASGILGTKHINKALLNKRFFGLYCKYIR